MGKVWQHPFKEGIRQLLRRHFSDSVVKNFQLVFEYEKFNKDNKNIVKQVATGNVILEIYYENPNGLVEFICDVASWWPKQKTEYEILRYITDKFKKGLIGKDWSQKEDKISSDVKSSRFETKES